MHKHDAVYWRGLTVAQWEALRELAIQLETTAEYLGNPGLLLGASALRSRVRIAYG